jgi:hypothetical protein
MFTVGMTGIASVILLAGCSDSGTNILQASAAAPPSSAGASITPEAWANQFCGALIPLRQEPSLPIPKLQKDDIAGAHRAFVNMASAVENYLSPGVEALTKLPASPIPDGDAAKAKTLAVFQPILDQTKAARTQLEAAPEDDKQAVATFAQNFQAIGKSLEGIPGQLMGAVDSPELNKAGENAPNCKAEK